MKCDGIGNSEIILVQVLWNGNEDIIWSNVSGHGYLSMKNVDTAIKKIEEFFD